MPVRVLYVVLNIHQGGLERVIGDLLRGLDPARFEIHVLALEFLGDLSAGLNEFGTMAVASPQSRWSMLWPDTLRDDIRRIQPDILHSHSGVWFKASRAARMAGVPFVVHTDHGRQSPDPLMHRLLDGIASRRTDVVVAVSRPLSAQLARTVVHDPSRLRVIHNGVDTERFRHRHDDGHLRHELGLNLNAPIIGSIGRLDPIKGFDVMIDAFAILCSGWNGATPHLVIAGDGPDRPRLEERIKALGMGDQVHLLGWRDDVSSLHRAFTIFTMSSRSEGTSIGLLEAMSARLCPVVTDVGGNRDVLGEALAHRLCASGDPVALANAWRTAILEPARRDHDAARAAERVRAAYSVSTMVEAHERLYEGARASLRGFSD